MFLHPSIKFKSLFTYPPPRGTPTFRHQTQNATNCGLHKQLIKGNLNTVGKWPVKRFLKHLPNFVFSDEFW